LNGYILTLFTACVKRFAAVGRFLFRGRGFREQKGVFRNSIDEIIDERSYANRREREQRFLSSGRRKFFSESCRIDGKAAEVYNLYVKTNIQGDLK